MKNGLLRIALFTALGATVALANFNKNVETLIQEKVGTSIKVIKTHTIDGLKGLKLVSVEDTANGQQLPVFVTDDGKNVIGFSNIFFMQNSKGEERVQSVLRDIQTFNESASKKKLNTLFKGIDEANFVSLKSTGKDVTKTTIIVTDPECPYCRKEMKELESKLETSNIKLLLAPVGKRTAFIKAQMAMDKIKDAKSDKDRISIVRAVYADDYTIPAKNNDMKTPLIDKNAEMVFGTGLVRGVPFIFELED